MDSTVSIINTTTLEEIKKVTVGKNPGPVVVDNEGDVYVLARGNYSNISSKMVKIKSLNDEVFSTVNEEISGIEKMGDKLLIIYKPKGNSIHKIGIYDAINEEILNPELISSSNFTTLYGIQYNSLNHKIYCLDAMNYTNTGYVKVFSESGIFETSYHVGLNPSKIIFYE